MNADALHDCVCTPLAKHNFLLFLYFNYLGPAHASILALQRKGHTQPALRVQAMLKQHAQIALAPCWKHYTVYTVRI